MIEFGCTSCGRFFRVSEDKAGKRSRCPDCGDVLQVPMPDDSELDFEEDFQLNCDLEDLRDRALDLISNGYNELVSCKAIKDNMLSIVVRCDGARTQSVVVYAVDADEPYIIFFSSIGNYSAIKSKPDAFFNLVVDCSDLPLASIRADNDGDISVQHKIDSLIVESNQLLAILTHIGKHADFIEQKYFMVDMH